jgi:hypothetical protein
MFTKRETSDAQLGRDEDEQAFDKKLKGIAGPKAAQACAEPIACILNTDDYRERMRWIATLNRSALKSDRLDDLSLVLVYEVHARSQVEELVRREQTCCPFLAFAVRISGEEITLTVTAPEAAREAVEPLFAAFRSR